MGAEVLVLLPLHHSFKGPRGSSQMGNNPFFTPAIPHSSLANLSKKCLSPATANQTPSRHLGATPGQRSEGVIAALHQARPKPRMVGPGPGQHRSPAPPPARPGAPLPHLAPATKLQSCIRSCPHRLTKGSPVLIARAGGLPGRPSPSAIKKKKKVLKKPPV